MKPHKVLLSALLLLLALPGARLQAQNIQTPPAYITVSGIVLDAQTHTPLVFANVLLTGKGLGNVTNGEGLFSLKFPEDLDAQSLTISYLGYESLTVPLTLFTSGVRPKLLLNPIEVTLPEATIVPHEAIEIVKSALYHIKDNYPQQAQQMTGFYREMIRKGRHYVTLSEAVIDVYKAPYTYSFSSDQVGIYKGRGSVDWQRIDTVFVKFQGGIRAALEIDLAAHPFLGVNFTEIEQYYEFKMESPVQIHDRVNYVISFQQLPQLTEPYFRGRLYIDVATYAITRAEFNMNVEDFPQEAVRIFVRRKPSSLKMNIDYATYLVQYKLSEDGKWVFDYSRSDLKFLAKWDKKWFRSAYTITSETAMTQYSPKAYKIPQRDRVRTSDYTLYKVADFEDPAFWEDYNVIEPEAAIEQVISRIIRQLKRRAKE